MKRLVITLAMLACVVTMASAVGSPQQPAKVFTDPEFKGILENLHPQELKSLRGIKGMAVVVDRVDSGLVSAGFRGDDVRNGTETILRGVNVSILTLEQFRKDNSGSFLKVKVEVDPETLTNKPYTGLVKVAFSQIVALNRQLNQAERINPSDTKWRVVVDTKDEILAETWHTQRNFKANDAKGIQDAALNLVTQFAHDYEQANR